jgi:hypothetical protein
MWCPTHKSVFYHFCYIHREGPPNSNITYKLPKANKLHKGCRVTGVKFASHKALQSAGRAAMKYRQKVQKMKQVVEI